MIIGRVTRDPEVRTTPSGANVCTLGLATNFVYINKETNQKVEQVEFHNVVLWRGLADIAAKYIKKGKRIYVEGRLQTRKWQTQNNEQRQTTEIIADNLILLDGGQGSPTGDTGAPVTRAATTTTSTSNQKKQQETAEEELPTIQQEEISIEDVPF